MHCSRNGAAAFSAHELTGVFGVTAGIDNHNRGMAQFGINIVDSSEQLAVWFLFEIAGFWNRRLVSSWESRGSPGVESAIEDVHIAVTEEFQEPEEASGSHA